MEYHVFLTGRRALAGICNGRRERGHDTGMKEENVRDSKAEGRKSMIRQVMHGTGWTADAAGENGGKQGCLSAYTIQGQDETGKWVRYDADGHMVKGWDRTK